MNLDRDFFARSVHDVAPELVGATLLVDGVGGRIVEVEAYDHEDPAAHGYRRPDRAQRVDVRPARSRLRLPLVRHPLVPELRLRGRAASAVLIRALEPRTGWRRCGAARTRRSDVCSAPARAGCARRSAITREHDGLAARRPPFELLRARRAGDRGRGPRIGITKAAELPWRYGVAGSRFVSRAIPPAGPTSRAPPRAGRSGPGG